MDSHLPTVLPGGSINGALSALVKHFGFLPENRRVGHLLARFSSHVTWSRELNAECFMIG